MTIDLELEPRTRVARVTRGTKQAKAGAGLTAIRPEMLTVGDLLELLKGADPSAPVVLEGQYGGFSSVRGITRVPLRLNVNRLEGFGAHERAAPDEFADANGIAVIVQPGAATFAD